MTDTIAPLPDKPSELIRLALADIAKCEADPRYIIDMGEWHEPLGGGTCAVCAAGAVMAKSLSLARDQEFLSDIFDPQTLGKLYAINWFRVGAVNHGLREMGLFSRNDAASLEKFGKLSRIVVDYHNDPAQFRCDMLSLAADLEEAGL